MVKWHNTLISVYITFLVTSQNFTENTQIWPISAELSTLYNLTVSRQAWSAGYAILDHQDVLSQSWIQFEELSDPRQFILTDKYEENCTCPLLHIFSSCYCNAYTPLVSDHYDLHACHALLWYPLLASASLPTVTCTFLQVLSINQWPDKSNLEQISNLSTNINDFLSYFWQILKCIAAYGTLH